MNKITVEIHVDALTFEDLTLGDMFVFDSDGEILRMKVEALDPMTCAITPNHYVVLWCGIVHNIEDTEYDRDDRVILISKAEIKKV